MPALAPRSWPALLSTALLLLPGPWCLWNGVCSHAGEQAVAMVPPGSMIAAIRLARRRGSILPHPRTRVGALVVGPARLSRPAWWPRSNRSSRHWWPLPASNGPDTALSADAFAAPLAEGRPLQILHCQWLAVDRCGFTAVRRARAAVWRLGSQTISINTLKREREAREESSYAWSFDYFYSGRICWPLPAPGGTRPIVSFLLRAEVGVSAAR